MFSRILWLQPRTCTRDFKYGSGKSHCSAAMYARLLLRRLSQVSIIAKAAIASTCVQGAVPTLAYAHRLLRSPLHFVLKAIGPAMAPAINSGVAERAVGHVRVIMFVSILCILFCFCSVVEGRRISFFARQSCFVHFLCSIMFVLAMLLQYLHLLCH